jgi:hypothetical protein
MKMHWCTARVNLSGQGFTVFWYDATNPISWPEAQVIMALHGEENVFEVKPVAIGETSVSAEKERLALKYGFKAVEQVFPGRNPRMEMTMPAESENLPIADEYGQPTGRHATENGNGHPVEEPPAPEPPPAPPPTEDEDGETADETKPADPALMAVMKPGRHQRPAKGA